MRTGFAWVATFAAAALAAVAPAFAQSSGTAKAAGAAPRAERLALVIGNGAYRDAPLPNPTNDAADVAKALEASGFTVIRRENASLREMHLALREFGDRLGRTTTGLFYFAGHGLQVRGRNYLLPVDADIAREDEVSFAALDLSAVLEKMDSARNPVNLVVLDACRNNPFGSRVQLAAKGLAQVDAPPGTFIAFATAPGSVAADGIGRNGLYTHHLLREMKKPGAAIEEVFKSTRAAVRKGSSGQQVPWESTSLESAFSFIDPPPAPKVAAAKNPRPAPAAATTAQGPARAAPKSIAAPPTFAVGDSWSYVSRDLLSGKERRFTIKVREIRDEQVRLSNGTVTDPIGNLLRSVSSGVESVYTPSSPTMPFPLQPGAALSGTYVQLKGDRHFDTGFAIRVVGEEEIEVPAGRFRAIRIERTAQWSQKGAKNTGTQSNTYWYSAAVRRLLANEVTNVTTAGKVLQKERIELEAYELR